METTFIYALAEPETGIIRYVGKANDPQVRYRNHIKDGRQKLRRDRKTRWIQHLLAENEKPVLVILEECARDVWEQRECFWIAYYRELGECLLCNHKDGGDGFEPDEQTRAKMSAAKLGKVPHNKGKQTSPEAKAKQSEAAKWRWQRMTADEKKRYGQKISAAPRPPISEETREKMRQASVRREFVKRGNKPVAEKCELYSAEWKKKIAAKKRVVSEEVVEKIRLCLQSDMKQRAIAKQFGVTEGFISRIKLGKAYKELD